MPPYELVTLKSGLKSLRCLEHQETFHPVTGPRIEANILHVKQQRLLERCQERKSDFVIWDVGFGAAANVLAAIEALEKMEDPSSHLIDIYSFDKSTQPIEFALEHAFDLEYLNEHRALIGKLLAEKTVMIKPNMRWNLILGDFARQLDENKMPAPHAVLYDPYSPVGNMEMWHLEHFRNLYHRLKPDVPCLLTNYTRSTAVRVSLILAGFYVGVGSEVGEKDETTIASNCFNLLEKPLDPTWLERVQRSRNGAPLRGPVYRQSPISEEEFLALKKAPQFVFRDQA